MNNITSLSLLTLISYRLGMMSVLDNHRLIDSLKVIQWFRFGDAMGPAISKTKEQNHESYIKNRTSHDAVNWFCHLKKNSPAPVKSCLKKMIFKSAQGFTCCHSCFLSGFLKYSTSVPPMPIPNTECGKFRIPNTVWSSPRHHSSSCVFIFHSLHLWQLCDYVTM